MIQVFFQLDSTNIGKGFESCRTVEYYQAYCDTISIMFLSFSHYLISFPLTVLTFPVHNNVQLKSYRKPHLAV